MEAAMISMGEASDLRSEMEVAMISMGEASESITGVGTVGASYRVLGEPSYPRVDIFDPDIRNRPHPYDPPYLPSYPISSVLSSSFKINSSSGTDYPSLGNSHLPLLPRLPPFPLTGPEILPFSVEPPPPPPLELLKNRHQSLSQATHDHQDNHPQTSDVPTICLICNRESKHVLKRCPYLFLATHLDVFKTTPPRTLSYCYYYAKFQDRGTRGWGRGTYFLPAEGDKERSAADAMALHKNRIYVVRITNLPQNMSDPERLYKLCAETEVRFVSHVLLFVEQSFGFVGFLAEEAAKNTIRKLNSSGYGNLTWATRVI